MFTLTSVPFTATSVNLAMINSLPIWVLYTILTW
nr:MAG TPA: hypothetical protein [Caudoviricetes sp.]